jgi:hypothetical protein
MFAHWVDRQGVCGVTNGPAPGAIEAIEQGIELSQFHVGRLANQDNIGISILIEVGAMCILIGRQMLSLGFGMGNEHEGQVLRSMQDAELP